MGGISVSDSIITVKSIFHKYKVYFEVDYNSLIEQHFEDNNYHVIIDNKVYELHKNNLKWINNAVSIIGIDAIEKNKSFNTVKKIAEEFENKIYIAMDVISKNTTEDEIMIKGWTEGSKLSSLDISRVYKESKIKGYILTSINHDGMMQGPHKEFYNKIDFYQKPLIFSGGYSSYLELELLSHLYFSKKDFINNFDGPNKLYRGQDVRSGEAFKFGDEGVY